MRKALKRIMTLALAGCMVFGMSATAFAADGATAKNDTGSITVDGLKESTTVMTVSAYQIAEASYDDDGNLLGYAMVDGLDACAFQIAPDGSYVEADLTEENLAELFAALDGASATGSALVSIGATSATIDNLPIGSYLIVVTGSESTEYGMMIGSVSYKVDEVTGQWAINNGSFTVEDCTVWAKATTPSVLKEETGGSLSDYEHGGSANVGDTLTYHITVSGIPSYQGSEPEFYVTDEIDTKLTITVDELAALTVTANGTLLTKDVDYTVTDYTTTPMADGNYGFVIDFVVDGEYTLNAYAGGSLVIEYQADVTSAGYAGQDHENDVILTYATTSYAGHDGGNNEGTDSDADHEYTFAFDAQKNDNSEEPLSGATFTLYGESGEEVATAVSGEDGKFSFTGLKEGTYTMKETKAPAGYALNQTEYTVVISATYDGQDAKNGGELTSWSIKISADGMDDITVTGTAATGLIVVDTHVGILPSMGGRGTLTFTLLGCAVIICAAVGVVASRKRRAA